MPNFIQCLQQGHAETDSEALKLYKVAEERARDKANRRHDRSYGADELAREIDGLLCDQLSKIDSNHSPQLDPSGQIAVM